MAIAAIPLYLLSLGSHASLDGHEILVAQTAREMLANGEWIVPQFSGEVRLQKPPLAYWLTAVSFAGTGRADEFAARFPVALATLAQVAMTAWFGARCFGARVGMTAGLLHATTFWTMRFGKSALVDSVLVTLVTAAILWSALDRLLPIRNPRAWVITFWIGCGLSVLAKGPVGLAIILPTVAGYRVFRTRRCDDVPLFRTWTTVAGLFVFGALAFGWPIWVQSRHPTAFRLWQEQSVGRFLEHWGPNTRPWFYYLYQVPLLTLPWTPLWLMELLRAARRGWTPAAELQATNASSEYRLLWSWLFVALVFFSLSEGKREHYVLPGLPPLSLLAALGLTPWRTYWRNRLEHRTRTFGMPRLAAMVFVLVAAVVAVFVGRPTIQAQFGFFLVFLAVGLATREAFAWTKSPSSGATGIRFFLFVASSWIVAHALVVPAYSRRAEALALFERNRTLIDRADQVIQYGSNDRWAIFPMNCRMTWPRSPAELKLAVESAPRPLLLVPRKRVDEVLRLVAADEVDDVEGESIDPPRKLVLLRPRSWR